MNSRPLDSTHHILLPRAWCGFVPRESLWPEGTRWMLHSDLPGPPAPCADSWGLAFVLPTMAQLPGLWGVMQRRPGPVPPGLTGRAMTVLTGRSPSHVLREPGLMDKEILPSLWLSPPGPFVSVTSGFHSLCPGDSSSTQPTWTFSTASSGRCGSQRWIFPFASSFQMFSESGNN